MFALVTACLLLGVLRYSSSRSVRDLGLVGLVLAVGIATRVEFIPVAFVVAICCAALAPVELRKRTIAIVLTPPAFVFVLVVVGQFADRRRRTVLVSRSEDRRFVGRVPAMAPRSSPPDHDRRVRRVHDDDARAGARGCVFWSPSVTQVCGAPPSCCCSSQQLCRVSWRCSCSSAYRPANRGYFVLMPLFQCVVCMWGDALRAATSPSRATTCSRLARHPHRHRRRPSPPMRTPIRPARRSPRTVRSMRRSSATPRRSTAPSPKTSTR